jgi:hypothetical protein
MERTLFTELSNAEQESLSGGADDYGDHWRFYKDRWSCYERYNDEYGYNYYVCEPKGRNYGGGNNYSGSSY